MKNKGVFSESKEGLSPLNLTPPRAHPLYVPLHSLLPNLLAF